MALYEHVFMVRQDASTGQVDTLTDQFKSVITESGGSIAKSEYWGVKSLTYRIKKNRKAHFTLMNLDCPSDALAEMERQMRINEDVIRFMTIKVDEHEDGPSAMVRSRAGRDDRRGPPRDRDRKDAPAKETSEKKED